MKVEQYVEELFKDIDLDGGYLSELSEEAPEELHNSMLEALIEKKEKRISFIPKRYISAAACIFIIIILISGIKNFGNIGSSKKTAMENDLSTFNTALDTKGIYDKACKTTQDKEKKLDSKSEVFEIKTKDSEIIGFLQRYGESTGENLYLLNKKYYEELKLLLDRKKVDSIQLRDDGSLNDGSIQYSENSYIIIKISK